MSLTTQENKSLHLYFRQMAEGLNNAGYGVKRFFAEVKNEEIDWTDKMIKELWYSIQLPMTEKTSTRDLTHDELDLIHRNFSRAISVTGVDLPLPSEEELRMQSMMKERD